MADPSLLKVALTFKSKEMGLGPTGFIAGLNAALISSFIPPPTAVALGIQAFLERGFEVTRQGKVSVSLRCDRETFERVFGTRLESFSSEAEGAYQASQDTYLYPTFHSGWEPDPALMELIDDAYIQQPHLFFDSRFSEDAPNPIPPLVNYYHLRVPGDLAMVLNAAQVHRRGYTGKGVRIAMLDSGFAHDHPFFKENGYRSSVVLAPGATEPKADGHGHGTGASANVFSVAPDVELIGVKMDNEQNAYQSATLLEAFQEARQHDPDIITVSLGYDLRGLDRLPKGLKALEGEVAAAVADGIAVIYASGNGQVAFPGMMPEVISVGGTYVNRQGGLVASDFCSAFKSRIYPGRSVPDLSGLTGLRTNKARFLMLPVPEECRIDKGYRDGTGPDVGWGVFSGTSAAAPQVAGVCALLLEKNPGLTPGELKQILRRTARPVTEGAGHPSSNGGRGLPAGTGMEGAGGAGLVDALRAWETA